jgi:DNA-binding CsgD family transcriptional regulator
LDQLLEISGDGATIIHPDRAPPTVAEGPYDAFERRAFPPGQPGTSAAQADAVSALIGEIYDAALDPSLWAPVLLKVRAFIGGSSAALFAKDAIRKSLNVYYDDGGLDPHYKQLYFDKYAQLDPFTTGHALAEVGEPLSTTDILSFEEFHATRFHREWAQPQGLVDFACAVLEKSATSVAMIGIFRHQRDGIVNDETRRAMRLIVPHIRRAVLIGQVTDVKGMEAATLADTLNGLSAGVFLVDENDRLIHANASGRAMLDMRNILHLASGRLAARSAASQKALREVFAAAGRGDAAVGTKGISIPLAARDGERYVVHVLPLTSGQRRKAGTRYSAVAAAFVHKAELKTQSPSELIGKTFDLTPSELRTLLAVVQVGGVAETAETLGVAESTIKTHLHRLFAKTGTSRQADLVKLVAGFSSPLAA